MDTNNTTLVQLVHILGHLILSEQTEQRLNVSKIWAFFWPLVPRKINWRKETQFHGEKTSSNILNRKKGNLAGKAKIN